MIIGTSSLSALVELGASLAGASSRAAERLAETLLATSHDGPWHSTLNNDGSPLQVSISLSGRGAHPAVRLVVDPAAEADDAERRWQRAGGALSAVLASHAPDLESLCHSAIRHALPVERAARAALPSAGIWLAADLSGQGMALYATAKRGDNDQRWMRARRWLEEILPPVSAASEVLDRLAPRTILVSAGVEGVTPDNARAKLYWRLGGTGALRDLGLPFFGRAAFAEFLSDVVGDRHFPRSAIVGSIGFRVSSGGISDAKLDVCCHCVRRPPADWTQLIDRTIARHGVSRLPVECPTLLEGAELALIGLGMDSDETRRVNVYLKRCLP